METAPKYPVLLVHGMAVRDNGRTGYWGRIPQALEEMGCRVSFAGQDSQGTIPANARTILERIDSVLAQTGAEKVNIIAHSKGGLDSRYAISTLGAGAKVASLTTLCTPHRGSRMVDCLMCFPKPLVKLAGKAADGWFRSQGDQEPASYQVFQSLTTAGAEAFNRENPDDAGVYYQSYAFVMKHPFSDPTLSLTNFVVNLIEGENDGLLPPETMAWGDFKGVRTAPGRRGISHIDAVDMHRRLFAKKPGKGVEDIVEVYREIVFELARRGF